MRPTSSRFEFMCEFECEKATVHHVIPFAACSAPHAPLATAVSPLRCGSGYGHDGDSILISIDLDYRFDGTTSILITTVVSPQHVLSLRCSYFTLRGEHHTRKSFIHELRSLRCAFSSLGS